jgi:hypothetical protein
MWLSSHAVSANSLPTAASSLETPPEGMLWALAVLLALSDTSLRSVPLRSGWRAALSGVSLRSLVVGPIKHKPIERLEC